MAVFYVRIFLKDRSVRSPDEPDEKIAGDYRGKREGDADLHEVGKAYLVAFLSEHPDARDIG